MITDMKPSQVERLWEATLDAKSPKICDVAYVSKYTYGSIDTMRLFASIKLMETFGSVFFQDSERDMVSSVSSTTKKVNNRSMNSNIDVKNEKIQVATNPNDNLGSTVDRTVKPDSTIVEVDSLSTKPIILPNYSSPTESNPQSTTTNEVSEVSEVSKDIITNVLVNTHPISIFTSDPSLTNENTIFLPLPPLVVQENLKSRAGSFGVDGRS